MENLEFLESLECLEGGTLEKNVEIWHCAEGGREGSIGAAPGDGALGEKR